MKSEWMRLDMRQALAMVGEMKWGSHLQLWYHDEVDYIGGLGNDKNTLALNHIGIWE